MTANSLFSIRQQRSRPPRICKAVGDSFRFVSLPFKRSMSWSTEMSFGTNGNGQLLNGSGSLAQIGNPLQVWTGIIGELTGINALLRLDYETVVNVLTIHYIGRSRLVPIVTRVKIIANIVLDKPFGTRNIELTPSIDGFFIFLQILY